MASDNEEIEYKKACDFLLSGGMSLDFFKSLLTNKALQKRSSKDCQDLFNLIKKGSTPKDLSWLYVNELSKNLFHNKINDIILLVLVQSFVFSATRSLRKHGSVF